MGRVTGVFDRSNILFVTGFSSMEKFCTQGASNADSFCCDDVLFEKRASVIFPNEILGAQTKSVILKLVSGGKKRTVSLSNRKQFVYSVDDKTITAYYFDFDMPFSGNRSVRFFAEIFDSHGKIGDYMRDITYIENLNYRISSTESLVANSFYERVSVLTPSSFLPKEYYMIPYSLFPGSDLTKKGQTSNFKLSSSKDYHDAVHYSSNLYLAETNIPEPVLEQIEDDFIKMRRGYAHSFNNYMEVGLKSAVNDRTNFEGNRFYKKKYKYLSQDDFVFDIDEDFGVVKNNKVLVSSINFKITPKQAVSFYMESKSGKTFHFLNGIDCFETKNNSGYKTRIEIDFNNSIFVTKFNPDVLYDVTLNDGTSESWGYNPITENTYEGGYCLFDTGGSVFAFRISDSDYNTLVLEGLAGKYLKDAVRMCIVQYLPDSLEVQSRSKFYRQKTFSLRKSRITEDFLEYEPIDLKIETTKVLEMEAIFRDSSRRFRGVNVPVTISGNNQFVYIQSQQTNYRISSYLDLSALGVEYTPESYLKFLVLGGPNYSRLLVPRRYLNSVLIILIKTESAVSQSSVVMKVTSKGVVEEFNGDGNGVVHTQEDDEGTLFKIAFDQSLYNYDFIEFEVRE